ncbi:MAG: endo-1,4-beta-xylanase [Verrucomicrobia bacterium]|nr:endo-1,4-beta-xylanase [Verrucomicrobiota bacterium]
MKYPTLVLLCVLGGVAFGARPPSGGRKLEFEKPFLKWQTGGRASEAISSEVVKVSNPSFKQAFQVEIKARTEREYDLQLAGRIKGQIGKGDVLLLSFYARCGESADESALGRFSVTGRAHHPDRHLFPFTKTVSVGKKWKQFLIPFVAPIDNEAGYSITFKLGGTKPQVLLIGGLELLNYHDKKKPDQLPATETYYQGMEPDAPWRKAAHARIEEHRKEDLKITVVDRFGNPVSNAKVHVELKNHAFGFGVAAGLNSMFNPRNPEDAQKYQEAVEDLFNKVVFENRMKWKFYQDGDPQLEEAIAWCAERGIPVRGHVMVWPAWKRLPRGMQEEWGAKTNEFRKVIEEHVRKMATVYPESFAEWDIVNELYTQHEFVDLYGRDVVADWFRIAKESNPKFKCYINDYAILAGYDEVHQQNYYDWIKYLLEQGAPVEGIGLQGHFRAPVPPEEILLRLDRFAEFGLEMQITEFDFEETDELLQARFTRDFMTAVFSHPQTTGIMIWCLWEDAAWKPSAAFYSSDWKKKRIAQAWEYMIKKEWHTDETVRTNPEGLAGVRGFLGDYEITVSHAGREKRIPFSLEKRSGSVAVTFK